MAIRYAVANGNWSNSATWDGGTFPGTTDDVYSNNFTVNIDQSVTVNSLKKISNGSPAIAAGGSFDITAAATVVITAGIATADNVTNSTYLLRVNAGSASVTITAAGGITGGGGTGREAVNVAASYTGTLTVNANLTGGSGGVAGNHALRNLGSCTLNVVGNISGASVSSSGAFLNSAASATITVTGNVTGGTISACYGIHNTGTSSTLTVNGNVTGGSNTSAYGVNNAATSGTLTVVGNLTGGSGQSAAGVFAAAGSLRIDSLLSWGSTGAAPVLGQGVAVQFISSGTNLGMQAPSDANWPNATGPTLAVQRYSSTGNPSPADVREGVIYGPSSLSTGALAVPPTASVAAGVPTDDTVGTAALGLADVLAGTGAQIAAATSG